MLSRDKIPSATMLFYSASDRGAEYCDKRVCLCVCVCVCVCVCLSAIMSSELHVRSLPPNFCACYLWPWLGPSVAA